MDLQRPTFENLPADLKDALTSMTTFLETLLMKKMQSLTEQVEATRDYISEKQGELASASVNLRNQGDKVEKLAEAMSNTWLPTLRTISGHSAET